MDCQEYGRPQALAVGFQYGGSVKHLMNDMAGYDHQWRCHTSHTILNLMAIMADIPLPENPPLLRCLTETSYICPTLNQLMHCTRR